MATPPQQQSRVTSRLIACPYCKFNVRSDRLAEHTSTRCKKARKVQAAVAKQRKTTGKPAFLQTAIVPVTTPRGKRVLVRSRLERLYHDLNQELAAPDEPSLANLFKSFYSVYVWKKDATNCAAPRKVEVDDNGEVTTSIRTVSGGLPSLGRRAK